MSECLESDPSDSHDAPSKRPSPSKAFEGWQYHDRSFILSKPSFSVTSVGVMAVSKINQY